VSLPSFIALLRGINVGGRARIPMPELRSLCLEHGWADVQTYIQSGNLLLRAQAEPAQLEEDLERAIERRFGFAVPVLVRSAGEWPAYVRGNPFQEESRSEPNLVMLALSKEPPKADAAGRLQERAAGGERVAQVGDALWTHFASGSARSKLTPALLDRLAGSAVTTRNWRTVLKLEELVRL
jgi:uncharacterized protein (DUF1697 family)